MTRNESNARGALRGRVTWTLVLIATLSLAGAATAGKKHKDGDGISDAAKETAKPASEQRVVHSDKKKDCDDDGGSGFAAASFVVHDHDGDYPPRRRFPQNIHVATMAAVSAPVNANFGPSSLFGIRAGIGNPRRSSLDMALMGGTARFAPGTDMAALLRRPREFAVEATARHSLTPEYIGFSIAPLVGFRAGILKWDYLNGILLEENGEVFHESSDWIAHYSPLAGVAMTFPLAAHLEIGAALIAGWRFYGSHSDLGLRNDLFDDGRFTELRLETRFTF